MPERRQLKDPADVFILEVPSGHGIEYVAYPSPAVVRPGAKKIRFRNFCGSDVVLDLSTLPVKEKSLTVRADGKQETATLRADAQPGLYLYEVAVTPYGITASGGSSPKVIIDI